jgi:hypothetical protein
VEKNHINLYPFRRIEKPDREIKMQLLPLFALPDFS